VLAVAATGNDGTAWLVELYVEDDVSTLEAAETATRLLVREAVTHPRVQRPARSHLAA
jgi:hypothetical protein